MRRILVAASDKAMTRFVAETLLGRKLTRAKPKPEGNGWTVTRAHSALETRLLIQRSGRTFDAIVVDQSLPGGSLLDLLDGLRSAAESLDTPIFVMAERGRDQLARREASERYLVAGFIEKPVTADGIRAGLAGLERRRVVLVVDGREAQARVSASALQGAGYDVEIVATGADALKRVGRFPPDAVLVALSLPDVPGTEVCMRIKRGRTTHTIPVVLTGSVDDLTALDIPENALRADDFLREPYDGAAAVASIGPLAGRGATPSEPPPPPPVRIADAITETEAPPLPPRTGPEREFAETVERITDTDLPPVPMQSTSVGAPPIPRQTTDVSALDDLPPASASPSPSPPNRRAADRVPCHARVHLRAAGKDHEAEALNISRGGILIATDHTLEAGTRTAITFRLPDTDLSIDAEGKVVWSGAAPETSPARRAIVAGIAFIRLSQVSLQTIADYVERVSRIVYVAP